MSSVLPKEQLDQLKGFVKLLKGCPEILNDPDLAFFRDYLLSMGATVPSMNAPSAPGSTAPQQDGGQDMGHKAHHDYEEGPEEDIEESDPESDLDLDLTGVIEPDNEEPQEMGSSHNNQEEGSSEEAFDLKRGEAMEAMGEGEWQKAIDLFTEAIKINSGSAMAFAKRGACYLKIQKPNACIRDCDRAIELNPDNAGAHKFRGRAHRLLGNFALAAKDLRLACKIDFDETADEWLREVTPNAKKIEEHERKKQRRLEEKELKEKKERIQKAKEARERAAAKAQGGEEGYYPRGPFGTGAGGPFGGGGMSQGLGDLLNDPELVAAFSDPEVAAAFQDISLNPANLAKYEKNPKVMALLTKMMSKFGGGPPSGPPGGEGPADDFFPGFPGFGGAGASTKPGGGPGPAAAPGGGPPPPSTDDLD